MHRVFYMRPVSRVCCTRRLLFDLRCLLHSKKGYHSEKGKAARWAEAQNVAHIEEACVRTTRPRPWRKTACDSRRNWDAAQLLVAFNVQRICSSSLRIGENKLFLSSSSSPTQCLLRLPCDASCVRWLPPSLEIQSNRAIPFYYMTLLSRCYIIGRDKRNRYVMGILHARTVLSGIARHKTRVFTFR